jgi:hypothetical protein
LALAKDYFEKQYPFVSKLIAEIKKEKELNTRKSAELSDVSAYGTS